MRWFAKVEKKNGAHGDAEIDLLSLRQGVRRLWFVHTPQQGPVRLMARWMGWRRSRGRLRYGAGLLRYGKKYFHEYRPRGIFGFTPDDGFGSLTPLHLNGNQDTRIGRLIWPRNPTSFRRKSDLSTPLPFARAIEFYLLKPNPNARNETLPLGQIEGAHAITHQGTERYGLATERARASMHL